MYSSLEEVDWSLRKLGSEGINLINLRTLDFTHSSYIKNLSWQCSSTIESDSIVNHAIAIDNMSVAMHSHVRQA